MSAGVESRQDAFNYVGTFAHFEDARGGALVNRRAKDGVPSEFHNYVRHGVDTLSGSIRNIANLLYRGAHPNEVRDAIAVHRGLFGNVIRPDNTVNEAALPSLYTHTRANSEADAQGKRYESSKKGTGGIVLSTQALPIASSTVGKGGKGTGLNYPLADIYQSQEKVTPAEVLAPLFGRNRGLWHDTSEHGAPRARPGRGFVMAHGLAVGLNVVQTPNGQRIYVPTQGDSAEPQSSYEVMHDYAAKNYLKAYTQMANGVRKNRKARRALEWIRDEHPAVFTAMGATDGPEDELGRLVVPGLNVSTLDDVRKLHHRYAMAHILAGVGSDMVGMNQPTSGRRSWGQTDWLLRNLGPGNDEEVESRLQSDSPRTNWKVPLVSTEEHAQGTADLSPVRQTVSHLAGLVSPAENKEIPVTGMGVVGTLPTKEAPPPNAVKRSSGLRSQLQNLARGTQPQRQEPTVTTIAGEVGTGPAGTPRKKRGQVL